MRESRDAGKDVWSFHQAREARDFNSKKAALILKNRKNDRPPDICHKII